MTNPRRLSVCFMLLSVLALPVLADGPPPPPCAPGEVSAPPCNGSQSAVTDNSTPGETQTPPASGTFEVVYDLETALWSALLF